MIDMKNLDLEQMQVISAGNKNRDCMIAGGAALGCALSMNWGSVFVIIAGAAYYGCFD